MSFVEVLDADDLGTSFEVRGPWKLMELKPSIWDSFHLSQGGTPTCPPITRGGDTIAEHDHQGREERHRQRRRGLILCDEWDRLFAGTTCNSNVVEVLSSPSFATTQTHTEADGKGDEEVVVVVLTPAAGFDSAGRRIGKGGGFYDRFIAYQRAWRAIRPTRRDPARSPSPVADETLHVWGVGLDEQLLNNGRTTVSEVFPQSRDEVVENASGASCIPVDAHDERMDRIITPSVTIDAPTALTSEPG